MRCSIAIAVALAGFTPAARAAPPDTLQIVADGCPSTAQVTAAMKSVLPGVHASAASTERVTVEDLGDGFQVSVRDQSKTIRDARRECAERALDAAVFAASILDPPPAPVPPAPSTPPSVVAPLPRARRLHVELELSALLVVAPQAALVLGGGGARVFVGTSWLGGIVGIAGLGSSTFTVGDSSARLVRVPIDVGLRASLRRGQLGLSGDLELVASPLFATGLGPGVGLSPAGVELGGRLAVSAQWRRWRRVAPFFAVELVVTTPRELSDTRDSRDTPPVWLGFALGADLALR